mmetsp:Transcript_56134/g.114776  ORF Transcript_56134/g.114776 Transcript_56134/m.114776 type:complete len:304 (+) Transcript_56134:52-963(+)
MFTLKIYTLKIDRQTTAAVARASQRNYQVGITLPLNLLLVSVELPSHHCIRSGAEERSHGPLLCRLNSVVGRHVCLAVAWAAADHGQVRMSACQHSRHGHHAHLARAQTRVGPALRLVRAREHVGDELVHERLQCVNGQVLAQELRLQCLPLDDFQMTRLARHVHQAARAGQLEQREHGFGHPQGAEEVTPDGDARLLLEGGCVLPLEGHAHVVHQHINFAMFGSHGGSKLVHTRLVGDVQTSALGISTQRRELGSSRGTKIGVSACQNHLVASLAQFLRRLQADTLVGTRNHSNLSVGTHLF